MLGSRPARGFSLVELMVALLLVGVFLTMGVPAFAIFLQNSQIRGAAESTLAGLQLARAEAIRRNAIVRFQLVSNLTSGCSLSTTGLSWVVSLADPTGACEAAPSDTAAPRIVQKRSGSEGTRNVLVGVTGGALVAFNGLGRVSGGSGLSQLNFSNTSGTCEHLDPTNGTMRCMQIRVAPGGQIKMCDPKVGDTTDPRHCS